MNAASPGLGDGLDGSLARSPLALFWSVAIAIAAPLSFLAVGVQPPSPSWGAMLADATDRFSSAWWYTTFPSLALLLTVPAFNVVGDGLRDALDPRTA